MDSEWSPDYLPVWQSVIPTTTSTDQLSATSLEAGVSAFKTAPAVSLITLPPTGSIQT